MIDQFNDCCRIDRRYFVRVATNIVGPEHAEDMVQDAYVLAFRFLHRFRGESSMKTWITRIVVNRCLAFLRKVKTEPAAVDIEPLISVLPDKSSPVDVDDDVQFRFERVSSAMRILKPKERAAIEYLLSTGTVGKTNKTLKFRAVLKLRTVLVGREKKGASAK